jgi:hypothetical protein
LLFILTQLALNFKQINKMVINNNEKFVTIPASKFEEMEKICNEEINVRFDVYIKRYEYDLFNYQSLSYLNHLQKSWFKVDLFKNDADEIIKQDLVKEIETITKHIMAESESCLTSNIEKFKEKYQNLSLFDRIFNWKRI